MRLFRRKQKSPDGIRQDLVNKLRRINDSEILRWIDNIHTGMGLSVQELRKKIGTHEEALMHVSDIREATEALQAALFVLRERRDASTVPIR